MELQPAPSRPTVVAALLTLATVNALCWVALAMAVANATGMRPSGTALAGLAVASGAAVVVACRAAQVTVD